ncbi:MAG: phosphoribosylanthranilate isomerase [Marivirga sp.]|jgi:phosphoribosylanthranilate isomerase
MLDTRKTPMIKICGMRYLPNVKEILSYEPDFLGFIFYVGSKRFTAAHEMDRIIKLDFGNTKRVGVFVNEEIDIILEFAGRGYFTHVQLHGDETPEYAEHLRNEGLVVMKALNVGEDFDEKVLIPYQGKIDYFLFDTKGKYRGGNGWKFDWNILKHIDHKTPFFLSGGLKPEDVKEASKLDIPKMMALDFNSQLETKPGIKNIELVQALFERERDTDTNNH